MTFQWKDVLKKIAWAVVGYFSIAVGMLLVWVATYIPGFERLPAQFLLIVVPVFPIVIQGALAILLLKRNRAFSLGAALYLIYILISFTFAK